MLFLFLFFVYPLTGSVFLLDERSHTQDVSRQCSSKGNFKWYRSAGLDGTNGRLFCIVFAREIQANTDNALVYSKRLTLPFPI